MPVKGRSGEGFFCSLPSEEVDPIVTKPSELVSHIWGFTLQMLHRRSDFSHDKIITVPRGLTPRCSYGKDADSCDYEKLLHFP